MSQLAPSCLVQGPWPFLGHRGFPDNTILENNFLFHDQLRWHMTPKTEGQGVTPLPWRQPWDPHELLRVASGSERPTSAPALKGRPWTWSKFSHGHRPFGTGVSRQPSGEEPST